MTEDQWLARVGLRATPVQLHAARRLLTVETEREESSRGSGDTALMRLCAAQLFIGGDPRDIALILRARQASQDAAGAIDAQMLCVDGAIAFCARAGFVEAEEAIADLAKSGVLDGFSVGEYVRFLDDYYRGPVRDA